MRWLVLTIMVFSAATCGQKGPLTHPDPEDGPGIELRLVAQTVYSEPHDGFFIQSLQH